MSLQSWSQRKPAYPYGVAQTTSVCLAGAQAQIDLPITDLRPVPFHGLWRSAVAARIAYGRIRDGLYI